MHQLIKIYLLFASLSIIPLYATGTDPVLAAIALKKEAKKTLHRQREKLQKVKDKERKSAREHKFETLPSSDNLSVIIGTLGVFTGPTQLACYKLAEEGRIKDLAKQYKLAKQERIEDLGDLHDLEIQARESESDLFSQDLSKFNEVFMSEEDQRIWDELNKEKEQRQNQAIYEENEQRQWEESEEDQRLWDELNKEEEQRQDQAAYEEDEQRQVQYRKCLECSKKEQPEFMNRLLEADPTNIQIAGLKTRRKYLQY